MAYTWDTNSEATGGEKTVISYRGTDNIFADGWYGWTAGAGFDEASQVGLAIEFYTAVTGDSVFDPADPNVLLTGHSLGGGLAGLISALSSANGIGLRNELTAAA